jgi:NAD(P)-dependent dehydrogenase (short-subunit alcohol dehydrogenase family)
MDLGLQGKVAIVTGSSDGIGYASAMLWREKGCVLSYVLDASLFLLRRAIASRGKPVLSWRQCRAMFNSCLTSRDWSRRQYNDSAPSIYSSTMQEAFRACNSPTWTMRSGTKY